MTGGGSGGHITPLLSLAHELKARQPDCRIIYIGHKGDNFDSLDLSVRDFDFVTFINGGKFRRYHGGGFWSHLLDVKTFLLNIRDFFRVIKSIGTALRILRKFRPDVLFSKGGFVSVPVGFAAHWLGIPIVTHDSDAIPGLANRIVGRWAKIHATGMPEEFYKYPKNSIRYVGIPLNPIIKKVTPKIQADFKKRLKLPLNSQVLLLSGGGNGSVRLNQLMVAIAPNLLESNLALYIIHVSGAKHQAAVKAAYRQSLPANEQKRVMTVGFSPDFYMYSGAADLVITRGGATTLAELAVAGKACIIIPSPFLTGGHQLKNAEDLTNQNAAVVAPENIEPDELLVIVAELLNNDHRRFELAKNLYATAKPDAAAKLAELILQVANREV
ncbi:MAG TPA: UDP-N-acetylglucosamine--N-acetylmuramyl-(pentapeptide) pyrophosphoryl-undecaprenol N-acetylglucosamine transferase [Candidatus Saccharimonadales bacterium]|nr:UDP-N-acetylglucosamine--N-acetylmuramyl-(pentapeptide) pyrophosphoryl-undecaprenol N-acetylglucosamine transferase [Candidatus Saccharimonadales bacterium]